MTLFEDDMAAQIATLTRVQDPAAQPLGYGIDLDCIEDCNEYFTEVDPRSVKALGQALIRRILSTRGSLIDDLNYGLNLRAYLNHGSTVQNLQQLGGRIQAEWGKDDRVQDSSVSVDFSDLRTLRISADVLALSPYTDFHLVFSVTSSQVIIDTIA